MWLLDKIADQRILEADKFGQFKGVPGEGKSHKTP